MSTTGLSSLERLCLWIEDGTKESALRIGQPVSSLQSA